MRRYSVLYTPAGSFGTSPVKFGCMASSPDNARAQCEAAHPGCHIVLVR